MQIEQALGRKAAAGVGMAIISKRFRRANNIHVHSLCEAIIGDRAMLGRAFAPTVAVPYESPLRAGTLVDRRDRFIAEVRCDEAAVVGAHCINPGRMEAFVEPGARVWLQPAPAATAATRKLKWSWEAIERVGIDGLTHVCGTNTVRPNLLVRHLLEARVMPGLDAWSTFEAERQFKVRVDSADEVVEEHAGRVDFLLQEAMQEGGAASTSAPQRQHYLEVKNVHLVYEDGWAYFPDSVSERASRHVDALASLVRQGHRATVLMLVQRADVVHGVRPSRFHDPTFAAAVRRAAAAGVAFRAVRATVTTSGTELTHEIGFDTTGGPEGETDAFCAAQWEANRETTGWTRSQSGKRVANGPFPHHKTKGRGKGRAAKAQAEPVEKATVVSVKTEAVAPAAAKKRSRYFGD